MTRFIFVSIFLLLGAQLSAQNNGQEYTADNGDTYLIGQIDPNALKMDPQKEWFEVFYDYHEPDINTIGSFKEELGKYHILLFMGTWCSDSQREVPALIKILETAGFPMEKLKIVAVHNRGPLYKTSPGGEEWGLQIKKVPTIIFLKDGREVNRIVESPVQTLEKDIEAIVSGKDYTPNYADLMKSK